MKSNYKILALSLFAALSFWLVDALMDAWLFYDEPFLSGLFSNRMEVVFRLTVALWFLFFGIAMLRVFSRQKRAEEMLKTEVAERRKVEERLRDRETFLENILETEPECVKLVAPDNTLLFMNRAGLSMIEADSLEQVRGKQVCTLVDKEHRAAFEGLTEAVMQGKSGRLEFRMLGLKGRPLWLDTHAVSLRDEKGEIKAVLGITRDITERKCAEEALEEHARHASLGADVGSAVVKGSNIREILQGCAESLVKYLDAHFARIWTFNHIGQTLELQASAGMYTHIDGKHSIIPIGKWKIGMIARERKPHLTNCVIGDPLISDQEWARREGIVSFAGYPLLVGDRLAGVMALFSRNALSESTLKALESIADVISLGIERREAEEEIRGLNQQLRHRALELEISYKDMESFSYAVSHDLKAPLRRMQGFSDILVRDYIDRLDESGGDALRRIASNAEKMRQLVDDLISFSRFTRGEVQKCDFDMEPLIKGIYLDLKVIQGNRNLKLEIGKLPRAYGDPAMISQVIFNLLSNAIKFTRTRETGMVKFNGYTEKNENVYCVQDNGIGFDMQFIDKLFGIFQRIHVSKEFEGTGIGLVIVKKVIEKHGGRVWAEGKPDAGAEFYFSLPNN